MEITISSAHKHLHLTKIEKLTVAIDLGLVMNRDHFYYQKSRSIEVRRMLLGISRKPSINTHAHSFPLSVSAALYMDSVLCFCLFVFAQMLTTAEEIR